mgnify:CR=1 FL=1
MHPDINPKHLLPAPCLIMVRFCWEVQCLDRHWSQMLWRYQETAANSETEDIKNKEYKFYLLLVFVLIIFVFAVWFLTANIHLDLWKSSSWSSLAWSFFVLSCLRYFQQTLTFQGVGIINVRTFTASILIPIPSWTFLRIPLGLVIRFFVVALITLIFGLI